MEAISLLLEASAAQENDEYVVDYASRIGAKLLPVEPVNNNTDIDGMQRLYLKESQLIGWVVNSVILFLVIDWFRTAVDAILHLRGDSFDSTIANRWQDSFRHAPYGDFDKDGKLSRGVRSLLMLFWLNLYHNSSNCLYIIGVVSKSTYIWPTIFHHYNNT